MADCKKYGRTANLFDYQTMEGTIKGYYLDSNGNLQESAFAAVTDYIPCSGGKFCLAKVGGISTSICLYDNNKHFLYGQAYNTSSGSDKQTIVVNSSVNASYIRFTYFYTAAPQDDLSTIMLNAGATALPYQPYIDWQHSLRKLGTSTDTITTLPADLYADGTNATVSLQGNMQQNGTPSPTTPIQPQECGERTENLFDYKTVYASYIDNDGNINANSNNLSTWNYFPSELVGKTVTIRFYVSIVASSYVRVQGQINSEYITGDAISAGGTGYSTITVTPTSTSDRWRITYGSGVFNVVINQVMINEGSTAKPYEPYSYKLDIKSASTTTPVYLGEVETTRKIKKFVITGNEGWKTAMSDNTKHYLDVFSPDYLRADNQITYMSSHYNAFGQTTTATSVPNNSMAMSSAAAQRLYIADANYTTNESFIQYLQQQYANGTPVTVWYVLATETTDIVNEPIRKIGTYADTVSGITIPTITGKDTFDVLTTLKPSEVSLNYTGWHDASVGEWDGSQWQ